MSDESTSFDTVSKDPKPGLRSSAVRVALEEAYTTDLIQELVPRLGTLMKHRIIPMDDWAALRNSLIELAEYLSGSEADANEALRPDDYGLTEEGG